VIFNKFGKPGTLVAIGCLAFSTLGLGQDNPSSKQSQSEKTQQQDSNSKKKKKDKKSKQKAKKDDSSRHPMDERAPIPNQPGRMDNPTIPQRTPGQQPAPGSPDPTSPTTTRPPR